MNKIENRGKKMHWGRAARRAGYGCAKDYLEALLRKHKDVEAIIADICPSESVSGVVASMKRAGIDISKFRKQKDWVDEAKRAGFDDPAKYILHICRTSCSPEEAAERMGVKRATFYSVKNHYGVKYRFRRRCVLDAIAKERGYSSREKMARALFSKCSSQEEIKKALGCSRKVVCEMLQEFGLSYGGIQREVAEWNPKPYTGRHYDGSGINPCLKCERRYKNKMKGECAECLAPKEYADSLSVGSVLSSPDAGSPAPYRGGGLGCGGSWADVF